MTIKEKVETAKSTMTMLHMHNDEISNLYDECKKMRDLLLSEMVEMLYLVGVYDGVRGLSEYYSKIQEERGFTQEGGGADGKK